MTKRMLFGLLLAGWMAAPLVAAEPIQARPSDDGASAHFGEVLRQALGTLARAGSYALDVESKWGAVGDPKGPSGASRYQLIAEGNRYRVEIESATAAAPELVCVNDGQNVTTIFPARALYSQHAVDSPQASIESNTMLAMSLQGSAIDIMLQPDVAGYVGTQASEVKDRGQTKLGDVKTHHFEVFWAGAKVELWFAAEGAPLLLQFTRTTCVPTPEGENYEMACTATFDWKLGAKPTKEAFVVNLPKGARRVSEIYDALSGEESSTRIDKPLPKVTLTRLDGSSVSLAAAADKQATVLIFWATWNATSVADMANVSQFVKSYKDRGVEFYAVNIGEQPGAVRRFTAKSPLQSTVLLDPHGKSASALRVTELPAIVIVGQDNEVKAILQGSAEALRGELAEELETLLSAAPGATNTARRPREGAKQ